MENKNNDLKHLLPHYQDFAWIVELAFAVVACCGCVLHIMHRLESIGITAERVFVQFRNMYNHFHQDDHQQVQVAEVNNLPDDIIHMQGDAHNFFNNDH